MSGRRGNMRGIEATSVANSPVSDTRSVSTQPRSKFRKAVSLQYAEIGDEAPRVNAKGENLLADEIVTIARRFGIPVVEKPEVARALSSVPLDQEIPEPLFEAVAMMLQELKKAVK